MHYSGRCSTYGVGYLRLCVRTMAIGAMTGPGSKCIERCCVHTIYIYIYIYSCNSSWFRAHIWCYERVMCAYYRDR